MENLGFAPYEGNGKYIFISYAHKNSEIIAPIVNRLKDYGYSLWYDEGIEYGDKWVRSIEEHIRNASVILSFISPEYADSDWCMREYTYSEKIGKKVIHIKISSGDIIGALSMMISNRQVINDNTMLTKRQIIFEIEKALNSCDIYPSKDDASYGDSFDNNIVTEGADSDSNEVYEEITLAPKVPKQKSERNNKKNTSSNKSKGPVIAGVAIAMATIAIAVVLILVFSDGNKDKDNTTTSSSTTTTVTTTTSVEETTEYTENNQDETTEYVEPETETESKYIEETTEYIEPETEPQTEATEPVATSEVVEDDEIIPEVEI